MKGFLRGFVLVLLFTRVLFLSVAETALPGAQFAHGDWKIVNGRLYQNDLKAGLAKMNLPVPQAGKMLYEFTVRYEDGFDDAHGGFGIHVFADKVYNGASWGSGDSYLLWLNYDENAKGITTGLSAQVYKSITHSKMELLADYDLNQYVGALAGNFLDVNIPVKIIIDGNNGDVKIYDPVDPSWVYKFNLGNTSPLSGKYISLRTNSLSVSFGK